MTIWKRTLVVSRPCVINGVIYWRLLMILDEFVNSIYQTWWIVMNISFKTHHLTKISPKLMNLRNETIFIIFEIDEHPIHHQKWRTNECDESFWWWIVHKKSSSLSSSHNRIELPEEFGGIWSFDAKKWVYDQWDPEKPRDYDNFNPFERNDESAMCDTNGCFPGQSRGYKSPMRPDQSWDIMQKEAKLMDQLKTEATTW